MSYQAVSQPLSANAASSFGLSPNVAALLGYIWIPVLSIAVLVTEKENRLVRFHAWQAISLGVACFAVTILLSIVIGVLMLVGGLISPYLGIVVSVLSIIVWLVVAVLMLGFWVLCLIKAYRGEKYQLPVVGKFADRMANK